MLIVAVELRWVLALETSGLFNVALPLSAWLLGAYSVVTYSPRASSFSYFSVAGDWWGRGKHSSCHPPGKTNEKPDFGFKVVFGPTTHFISPRPSSLSLLSSSFSFLPSKFLLQTKPLVLTREAGLGWGLLWLDSECVRGPRDPGERGRWACLSLLSSLPALSSQHFSLLSHPFFFFYILSVLFPTVLFYPRLSVRALPRPLPCHLFTWWGAWPNRMQTQTLCVKYDSLMVQSISENTAILVFRVCSGMVCLVRCEDSNRKA